MKHKQWFEIFPEWFLEERQALENRGFVFDEEKFESEKTVMFKGTLPDYPERSITIEFPRTYPSIAPMVYDDGACDLLPRHQKSSNRVYCLFGPEGKEWCANSLATAALDETTRLLKDVLDPGDSGPEDPNPEPPSAQTIFVTQDAILVPPGISDYLPQDLTQATSGSLVLKFFEGHKSQIHKHGRGVVIEAKFNSDDQPKQCLKVYENLIVGAGSKVSRGSLMFVPSLERPIYDGKDLSGVIAKHGLSLQSYDWHALVFPEESGSRKNTRYTWLFFRETKGIPLHPIQTNTYRTSENSVRIPGLEWLPAKRVAIIGCGSIGSKIAVMLASSGVSKFVLVDRDTMEPANSIRHECGIDTFALNKTHALIPRLTSINPDCAGASMFFAGNPFNDCNPETFDKLLDELQECDLMINASGSDRIGRYLNQLAFQNGTPCLHASATNGAWSGEIIRSIPGRTPCWQCWDHAYGENPPPGEPNPQGRVFGPGCDQPTFTGTSHDIGMVANLAAAFSIDTLRTVEQGRSEYSGDYLLWEGRDSAGRPLLKSTIKEIPQRETCPSCGNVR